MGMACDADARGTVGSSSSDGSTSGTSNGYAGAVSKLSTSEPSSSFQPTAATAAGMNAEETALILASLSKGQFGPVTFATDDSDPDDSRHHSDMEDLSGDEHDEHDDDDDDEHGRSVHASSRVHRVQQINFDGPVGSKLDFLDDAGLSHRFRNESNRVKSLVTKHISIDELRAHFDRPIIDVAKDFGICITLMKKICRRNGIKRWPHRQIRSLSKSIASMEAAMLSAHGGERDKYRDQIATLTMKRESVIADPNKESASRPKTPPGAKDAPAMTRMAASQSVKATSQPQVFAINNSVEIKAEPHASGYVATNNSSGAAPAPTTGNAHAKGGRWTSDEHAAFLEGIRLYGKDWRRVAQVVATRSAVQTRTHAQKYLLKFAGRFPFDSSAPDAVGTAGSTSSTSTRGTASTASVAVADDDAVMASPRSDSQHQSYDDASSYYERESRAAWSRHDDDEALATSASRVAVEAMAMILNSPESVSSQTTASSTSPSPVLQLPTTAAAATADAANARGRDALMYSPMSATSSFGRALPSLAIPAIKSDAASMMLLHKQQRSDSPVGNDDIDDVGSSSSSSSSSSSAMVP